MALYDVLSRTAERYVLIQGTVVADFRRFADNNTRAVVDEKPLSDFRTGVDFNASFRALALGNVPRNKVHLMLIKPVSAPIAPYRLV